MRSLSFSLPPERAAAAAAAAAEPVRALPQVRQDAFDGRAGGRREGANGARRLAGGRPLLQLRRPAGSSYIFWLLHIYWTNGVLGDPEYLKLERYIS